MNQNFKLVTYFLLSYFKVINWREKRFSQEVEICFYPFIINWSINSRKCGKVGGKEMIV